MTTTTTPTPGTIEPGQPDTPRIPRAAAPGPAPVIAPAPGSPAGGGGPVRTGEGDGSFEFDSTPFAVHKQRGAWTVTLRHADVPVSSVGELDKLTFTHPDLMECRLEWHEDRVALHLTVDEGWTTFEDLRRAPRVDKLRAMANIAALSDLVGMGYTVVLDPANLLFDRNLCPKLAYRGLAGIMPPAGHDQAMFLRQYQALTLAMFDKKATFARVYAGAMTLKHASQFDKAVTSAGSPHALAAYLTSLFDEQRDEDDDRLARVSRRGHAAFKQLTIWLTVLSLAAMGGVAYYTFVYAPFQERMLAADTDFVKKDYDALIEQLRPVAIDRLPATQRYELAFSFLQGTNLSDEQRATIMNNLALNSEPAYLNYWIEVGRGRIDDALDTAKGLGDLDLILYAITLSQEQVKNDTKLSGTERAEKLDQLQQDYDKYLKARNEQTTGAGPSASPSASPSAQATPEG